MQTVAFCECFHTFPVYLRRSQTLLDQIDGKINSVKSRVETVSNSKYTKHFYFATFDLFWTIAKPSHRDYFELHRMQINIYRTMVELRTLTIDTKLFTTLWIVQNHTNTALIIEILALSPFKDSGCVCCPLMGDYKNWRYGMSTKTLAKQKNVTILKLDVVKLNPPATPRQE